MGDAAGVGPEVVMKALAHAEVYAQCRPLVIGDARQLARAKAILKSNLKIFPVPDSKKAKFKPGTIDLLDLALLSSDIPYGKVSAMAGEAAYRYVEAAVKLALDGKIAVIVTAPLNKAAMHAAGHHFDGHTELLPVAWAEPHSRHTLFLKHGPSRYFRPASLSRRPAGSCGSSGMPLTGSWSGPWNEDSCGAASTR